MAIVVPNVGEQQILGLIFGVGSQENLSLRLFTNNITPAEATVLGSFTEATGNGYARQTIAMADWSIVAGDPTYATATEKVFAFTGALGNVYGYYIVGESSGNLYWCERFTNAPIAIQNNGDQIRITPKLGLE